MNRILLVWFAFFGVFAAGAITGGIVESRFYRSVLHKRASEEFTQQQFRRLADELNLTEEQRQRIHPILTKSSEQIQQRRRENLAILQQMEQEVRAQLTPEQQIKFDRVRDRQRDNERVIQRWLHEQRSRRQERLNQRLNSAPSNDPPASDLAPTIPRPTTPSK